MKKLTVFLAFLVSLLTVPFVIGTSFADGDPSLYDWVIPLDYENLSGTDIDWLMPIEVNALALVNLGIIATTTDDYLFTDPLENQVAGFAQDLDDNGVRWWSHAFVPNGTSTTNLLFVGGPDIDDGLPTNRSDMNDAHIEVPDSAPLRIVDDLDLTITLSTDTVADLCGTVVEKVDRPETNGRNGYGLYMTGALGNGGSWTVGTGSVLTKTYYDFTPAFDMYVCGIYVYKAGGNLSQLDIVSGTLTTDTPIATYNDFFLEWSISSTLGLQMFSPAVLMNAGQTYRFYETFDAALCSSVSSRTATNSIGTFAFNGEVTHSTLGTYRGVCPSFQSEGRVIYYDGIDPKSGFLFTKNSAVLASSTGLYDGTQQSINFTFLDPAWEFTYQTLSEGTGVSAGNIATTTDDMIIGKNIRGAFYDIDLQASSTSVLDIPDTKPNRIHESQEGTIVTSWLWKSTITDDSASMNDAIYMITADTTNVNIQAGALAQQPTPTPVVTPEVLTGFFDGGAVGPFTTPIPTIEAELPGTISPPSEDIIQAQVYYAIFGLWALTLVAGFAGRFLSEYMMAGVFIIGYSAISSYAGADFTPDNVVYMSMGATGIALILHQGR